METPASTDAPRPPGPIDRGLALAPVLAGGFLMGSADIVPGVSGGTVALLLGIYERLLRNIRAGAAAIGHLGRGHLGNVVPALQRVEWAWLIALLTGVVSAFAVLAGTIEHHLEVNPVPTAGLFGGLVLGSIVIATGDVRRWDPTAVTLAAGSAVAAFVLLGLRSAQVTDPGPLVFLLAGAFAICAMILPGVSGSFLLLTVGMYEPVLDAADARDLLPLLAFAVGAGIGLGSFSTVLTWALERWHDWLLAVLVGLMAGSMRVLWPWPAGPDGVGDTRLGAPDGDIALTAGLAATGLVAVVAIARIARARLAEGTGPVVSEQVSGQ